MKDYRSYMDTVSVDAALHRRIMDRVTKQSQSARRSISPRHYTAVLACAALVLLCVWAAPRLQIASSLWGRKQYSLVFNRAETQLSRAKKHIPGYFTQELSQEDLRALLGSAWDDLIEDRTVSATAGFSGEGVLDGVTVACDQKASGLVSTVQMTDGPAWVQYSYPDEPEVTDVNGTGVAAGYWEVPSSEGETVYYASFELGQTGYYVELSADERADERAGERAKEELTALVHAIIKGGAADLAQITPDFIPEWREKELTLVEAQADPDFGAYVPRLIPPGFTFESCVRILNQRKNELRVDYADGMKYLGWTVQHLSEEAKDRVVDIDQPDTYDLSLYPIPRAESVPDELREIVNDPIFRAEDLTLDVVLSRAYTVEDAGDVPGYRMHFSVLYGDVLVEVDAKGVEPEAVFDLLRVIGSSQ